MNDNHYLVPIQIQGAEKDVVHAADATTAEDAEDWFVDAKEKLLDVNNWKKYSDSASINFVLTDSKGRTVKRNAYRGDHIRIESPLAGTGQGSGFDWVTIEALEYDDYPDTDMEAFAMRVRPSAHPDNMSEQVEANTATSTFVIDRRGRHLHATYHGRNELAALHDPAGVAPIGDTCDAWMGLPHELLEGMVRGFLK